MTHRCRKPLWDGCGRLVSFGVQLSDIARHFHTGDELGITRFSSCLSQGNAMTLVCCRKSGPFFLYLLTSGLLTLHALLKTGLLKTCFQLPLHRNSVTDRVHIESWDVIRSRCGDHIVNAMMPGRGQCLKADAENHRGGTRNFCLVERF